MRTDSPVIVRRSDYRPSDFLIDTVELQFDLEPAQTRVKATLAVRRNPANAGAGGSAPPQLLLNGEGLETVDLQLNGRPLADSEYQLDDTSLVIFPPQDSFELKTEVIIAPKENTSLSGLYVSNGNFFTQCEAEGFRRITWFADRPDIMAIYSVRLSAPKADYPVLLSNGNLTASGQCPQRADWHWAQWQDPFPKPSYLFALVAGNLVCTEKTVRTMSQSERLLQVWVEPGNEDKTDHAMDSLIRAMRWDEQRYGLELDLDRFMIVAVADFNMGAMENKGLNIFNTKYVFANPKIATDADFANVESVVGHEYFHNWTGNRVTCRDWFQLTLKEGLTVFRDQEFSADVMAADATSEAGRNSARVVKRIEDVRLLRIAQFAEDAGPMAHPIRPDTYAEINNFYTVTVYEKGAEVIRMLQTLVGRDGFRRGMDLYFQRHDGQAVTCDDFVNAIASANQRDFSQFGRWYAQAGTPVVNVRAHFDAGARNYTLTISQLCPPTPDQAAKAPFHIPFSLALLDDGGQELPLRLAGETVGNGHAPSERVLELTESEQQFVFENIDRAPVPSLLRGFSAPVILDYPYSDAELSFLARHETDPFNRWEAIQRQAVNATLAVFNDSAVADSSAHLLDALVATLRDGALDPAYQALVLTLPGEGYIAEQLSEVDPTKVRAARNAVRHYLAQQMQELLQTTYRNNVGTGPYQPNAADAGRRAIKNVALSLLVAAADNKFQEIAADLVASADNMTDQAAALSALVNSNAPQREGALDLFAKQFANEALVMDKWFSLQATMHRQPGDQPILDRVRSLQTRPDFSLTNPNRVRSLVGAFCSGNLAEFHSADGSGYQFWLEQVQQLDTINPQIAARLARALDRWRKFDHQRQVLMKDALNELAQTKQLSGDVSEIVQKALAAPLQQP